VIDWLKLLRNYDCMINAKKLMTSN